MKRLFQFSRRTPGQIRRDVGAELRFHLEARIEDLIGAGVPPDEAKRQAMAEFGDVGDAQRDLESIDLVNESHQRRREWIGALQQDLHYALRTLKGSPAFALAVIGTLALGIGANVAIFSVIHAVLLAPLPFSAPDRLVAFTQASPLATVSEPEFVDYQRDLTTLSGLSAYAFGDVDLATRDEPRHLTVARVSGEFFGVLGSTPYLGRTFRPEEDRRGAPPVMILSYGEWVRDHGADPGIVGRTTLLNGNPVSVIGVMPQAFDFPLRDVAAWLPLQLNRDSLWSRNNHYLRLVGRLRPGATVAATAAEATTLDRRWAQEYPQFYDPSKPPRPDVRPIRDDYVRNARPYLLALLGAVASVLLIACTNVANLLLARGETRRREHAVRIALGATTRRLVTQLLTESFLLALVGGTLGIVIAWLGGHALVAAAPDNIPRLAQARIDRPVLLFAMALSVVAALLFGLFPALRAGATQPFAAPGTATRSGTTAMLRGARRVLVIAEVVLAVVLLGETVLLVRSLQHLQEVDLGFRPAHLLTIELSPPARSYDGATAVQLYRTLQERIGALPGVLYVAAMGTTPIADGGSDWSIAIDGQMAPAISGAPSAAPQQVTPGYFATMGTELIAGRDFTDADGPDAPLVVIINATMARRFWPGTSPLGHTLKMYAPTAPLATIIGVVRDVRSVGIEADAPPTMYFPHAQAGRSAYYTPVAMTLAVRAAGDPAAIVPAVRNAIHGVDRNIALSHVRTMDDIVSRSIASRRFGTGLLAAFAVLALVLAALGIFGVVAYGVSRRTSEIGLRMALGSSRGRVMGLIVGEALRTAAVGAVAGLAGAALLARVMRALLVGVTPFDLPVFALVAAMLLVVVTIAAIIPARRASTVSPVEALRE